VIKLERKRRFSESILWELQRDYFIEKGVDAWSGAVPFYITSNPFIANCYANIAIRYIEDYINQNEYDSSEPFYVVELGTGSGKFSYYMMKRLFELRNQLNLASVKICYVMTDFTESNVKFWQAHDALKPFVERKELDFALFNLEESKTIELIEQKRTLSSNSLKNPLVLCANYIFDTVSHDAFRVVNGVLQESLITCETAPDNMKNRRPVDMAKIETHFDHRPVKKTYYKHDDALNRTLMDYPNVLNNSSFLMPVGALTCVRHLMELSQQRLLVLATDKSYTHVEELQGLSDPHIAFHGSFSMMVNLHAVGRYFEECGGDGFHQSLREGIKSSAFVVGKKFDALPETRQAVNTYFEQFGPSDYFHFHRYIVRTVKPHDWLRLLAAHMGLNHWDPYAYGYISDIVNEEILKASSGVKMSFFLGMKKLADNFYYMPGVRDTYFDIATFFSTIHQYKEALSAFQLSVKYYGEKAQTLYNIGLCYYFMHDKAEALSYLEKADQANTDDEKREKIQEWVKRVRAELKP
jgi:tetratricopeptide (TPR) repeat protein